MKQVIKNDMYNKIYSIDQLSNNSPIFKEYLQEMKKDRGNTLETIDEDDINNNQNFQNFFVELTQKDFFPKNKINRENKKLCFNKIKIKKNILRLRKSRNLDINNFSPLNSFKKVKTAAFINKNNFFQTQNSNENSINDKKKITVSVDSFSSKNFFPNISPINSVRNIFQNSNFNLQKRSESFNQIVMPGEINLPFNNKKKRANLELTLSKTYFKSFEKNNINLKLNPCKIKNKINYKLPQNIIRKENRCSILDKIRNKNIKFQKEFIKQEINDNILKMLDRSLFFLFNKKKKE